MPSLAAILGLLEHYISIWGIIIIPIGAFLENSVILGFIFPGVTLIFLSGYVARTQGQNILFIVFLAVLGSFLGDNFDYLLGRHAGKFLLKKPIFEKPVNLVEPFLKKHGIWAVVLGRFSAWSRAWVALASGIVGFSYIKFAAASLISAILWVSIWILGGYLVGGNQKLIEDWLNRGALVFWIILLAVLVYYFRTRIKLLFELLVFEGKKHGSYIRRKITR